MVSVVVIVVVVVVVVVACMDSTYRKAGHLVSSIPMDRRDAAAYWRIE